MTTPTAGSAHTLGANQDRPTALGPRAGFTLIELLVVLAVLALSAVMAGVGWQANRAPARDETSALSRIQAARGQAIRSGHSVTIELSGSGSPTRVVARPGGQVLGAEHLGVDPLTGVVTQALSRSGRRGAP